MDTVSSSETSQQQQTSSLSTVSAKPGAGAKTHCKNDSGSYEDMLSGKVASCSSHGSSSSSSGCGSSGVGSPAQAHIKITISNGEWLAN